MSHSQACTVEVHPHHGSRDTTEDHPVLNLRAYFVKILLTSFAIFCGEDPLKMLVANSVFLSDNSRFYN